MFATFGKNMNNKFTDIYHTANCLTSSHMCPSEMDAKLYRLNDAVRKRISNKMRKVVSKIDPKEYTPDQGSVIMAAYAAAVADDFGTEPNIVLLAMFADQQ